jgi:hypothetical protein
VTETPPRIPMPTDIDRMTPEQVEAMKRFSEEIAHAVQVMIDAFEAFGRACVAANEAVDAMHAEWEEQSGFPTTHGEDTPT